VLLIVASCNVFSGACMCVSVLCISALLQLKCSSLYVFLPCSSCPIVFIVFYACLILQNKDWFLFRLLQVLTAQILLVH